MYVCFSFFKICVYHVFVFVCRDACNSFCNHLVSLEDFQELKQEFAVAVKGNCSSSKGLIDRLDELLAEKNLLQLKFRDLQEQLLVENQPHPGTASYSSVANSATIEQLLLGSSSGSSSTIMDPADRETSCSSPIFSMLNEKASNTSPTNIDSGKYNFNYLYISLLLQY